MFRQFSRRSWELIVRTDVNFAIDFLVVSQWFKIIFLLGTSWLSKRGRVVGGKI